jgi:hypothetical protein
LACWRISAFVVYDIGPWQVFSRLREMAGLEYDDHGRVTGSKSRLLGALGCLWCFSIWVGFLMTGVYLLGGERALLIASLPFALSMGSIMWEKLVE